MKNSKTSLKMLPPVSQLLSALDAVPSYIYIKDRHSRYIYANKHTLMLFGCSLTELIGRSDDQFFPPNVVVHLKSISGYFKENVLKKKLSTRKATVTAACTLR